MSASLRVAIAVRSTAWAPESEEMQTALIWLAAMRRAAGGAAVPLVDAALTTPRALALGSYMAQPLQESYDLIVCVGDAAEPRVAEGDRTRVVRLQCKDAYMQDQEAWLSLAAPPPASTPCAETWVHANTDAAYAAATLSSGRLVVVPQVWSAEPLLRAASAAGTRLEAWRGGSGGVHLVIAAENASAAEAAWFPLVVAEAHYTKRGAPTRVHLYLDQETKRARSMRAQLQVDAAVTLHPHRARMTDLAATFAAQSAVLVTHLLHAPPAAMHFAALWLGLPLVHNSPLLAKAGLGFAYEGNDVEDGARAVARALAASPAEHATRRSAARAWLKAMDPASARVQSRVVELLADILRALS